MTSSKTPRPTDPDEIDAPRDQLELELAAQSLAVMLLRAADAAAAVPTLYADCLDAINRDRTLDGPARERARRELWSAATAGVKLALRGPWGRLQ